jgi:hypothetical protein
MLIGYVEEENPKFMDFCENYYLLFGSKKQQQNNF